MAKFWNVKRARWLRNSVIQVAGLLLVIGFSLFLGWFFREDSTGLSAFTEQLEEDGYTFTETKAAADFLNGSQTVLGLSQGTLYVYEYWYEFLARLDARLIAEDGRSADHIFFVQEKKWEGTPHFYIKGRLIVNYVGEDASMLRYLEAHFGDVIAGGSVNRKEGD